MDKPYIKTDAAGRVIEDNRPGATTVHVLEKDALAKREERFTKGIERIADTLERYVDEKIESDKVLCGILRDMNIREEIKLKENQTMQEPKNNDAGVTSKAEPSNGDVVKALNQLKAEMAALTERCLALDLALETKVNQIEGNLAGNKMNLTDLLERIKVLEG